MSLNTIHFKVPPVVGRQSDCLNNASFILHNMDIFEKRIGGLILVYIITKIGRSFSVTYM